ncbi:unnamed protein product [Urochloa humidicola]
MPPGTKGKRGRKALMEGAGSSIDDLPDGILQHILGFLPAWDAVRTCVLARRWRYLWMLATGLRIIGNEDDDMEELRESVDHLLLARGIAPLETCELRFEENDRYFVLRDPHLVSQHLLKLELDGVEVKESFLNLSGCPALEQLAVDNSDLCLVKKILSKSLKCLSITNCEFNRSFRTHIDTPSLVSLLLDDNLFKTPVLESMPSLVDVSIRIVSINVDSCDDCDLGDSDSCRDIMIHGNNNCILLQGLSKAKNLALVADSKTFIFRMDLKWCPTFSKLKTLLLCDFWCVALDLDTLSCIIKNSPVLEKLTLELFSKGSASDDKIEMKGNYTPVQETTAISEHLKIVEVKCDVVDKKVHKLLKLLSTFNIRFSFE